MKATLEFNLPEDGEEFRVCQQGVQWKDVLSGLAEWIRHQRKHADLSIEELAVYDKVWERIWENVKDEGLRLW